MGKVKQLINTWSLYFALVLFIGPQLLIAFWGLYPYEPLRVEYIKPIEVKNGERFVYEISYEKFNSLPALIGRQLVDGITVSLPYVQSNLCAGKKKLTIAVAIPKLPPGEYYFNWFATYAVNPIRDVTVSYRTAPFTIE